MMDLALGIKLRGTKRKAKTENAAYSYIIKNSRGELSWLLETFIPTPNLY